MNRIRTLKPEIHSHRKTGPLSDRHFRLFVGLITLADDEGRLVAEPDQLRVLIFGYHPKVRRADVEDGLRHLAERGLLVLYTVDGTPYGWLRSWADHQRINRPSESKLPAPPTEVRGFVEVPLPPDEPSVSPHGVFSEPSLSPPASRARAGSDLDRKGRDVYTPAPDGERAWLDCLNREAGTHFKPTESNLRPIRARIREGHTLTEAEAVVRAKVAEWRGTDFAKFLRPSTLFGPKFDSYLQACGNGHRRADDDEEI